MLQSSGWQIAIRGQTSRRRADEMIAIDVTEYTQGTDWNVHHLHLDAIVFTSKCRTTTSTPWTPGVRWRNSRGVGFAPHKRYQERNLLVDGAFSLSHSGNFFTFQISRYLEKKCCQSLTGKTLNSILRTPHVQRCNGFLRQTVGTVRIQVRSTKYTMGTPRSSSPYGVLHIHTSDRQ